MKKGFGQRPVVVSAPGPFMTLFWFVRVPRFLHDRDTAPRFQSLSIPQWIHAGMVGIVSERRRESFSLGVFSLVHGHDSFGRVGRFRTQSKSRDSYLLIYPLFLGKSSPTVSPVIFRNSTSHHMQWAALLHPFSFWIFYSPIVKLLGNCARDAGGVQTFNRAKTIVWDPIAHMHEHPKTFEELFWSLWRGFSEARA